MSESQKTPTSRGLTLYINQMIQKFLDRLAKGRPATVASVDGSIVTVNFEMMGVTLPQVTMPLAGPEYLRFPTQVGDKGFCVPCDYYLGAMSGLGTGTADTTPRGNLSTLVFLPIGNKNWTAPTDPDAAELYGPNGVILRDSGSACVFKLTPTGVTVTLGSNEVTMTSSEIQLKVGSGTLTLTSSGLTSSVPFTAPDATLDGIDFGTHTHNVVGVQAGASTLPTTVPL